MSSVSRWLFFLFLARASQMIFDRNVEEPSINPESALSFPLAWSWLSTLSCQVTFPGGLPSHIFCLPQGYTQGLKALFVDSYGPNVNMFLRWFCLNAKRSVRWLVMKTHPVLLTTQVRKLEKPLISVFLAAEYWIVVKLDRTLACSWLNTLST